MSLEFVWDEVNNQFVSDILASTINYIIMENRDKLLGGFAFIEEFNIGSQPPLIELVSVDTFTDDIKSFTIRYAYNNELRIKAQAYAPINPVHPGSKLSRRGRLHMNMAESDAPGYVNAWVCIKELHINGEVKTRYNRIDNMLSITLDSFPVKRVAISSIADNSVIATKISTTINDALININKVLGETNYTIYVPLGNATSPTSSPSSAAAPEATTGSPSSAME